GDSTSLPGVGLDQLRVDAGLVEDAADRPPGRGEGGGVALGHLLEERLVVAADQPEGLLERGLGLVLEFRNPGLERALSQVGPVPVARIAFDPALRGSVALLQQRTDPGDLAP